MIVRGWRADLRLAGVAVMISFVLCHFANHALALVSLDLAMAAHRALIGPWRSPAGTGLLLVAGLTHYGNALWSLYQRRSLRMPAVERWQLGLGLLIPALMLVHLTGTRLAEEFLGLRPGYPSVLLAQWVLMPWKGALQAVLVVVLWGHACVGLHLRLKTSRRYPAARPWLLALAVVIPTLALAGWVAAGNHVLRAAADPDWVHKVLVDASFGPHTAAEIARMLTLGLELHGGLIMLAFACRLERRRGIGRWPLLSRPGGPPLRMPPGATVLETLRDHGIPHAAVCGGLARCTTCRVRILAGGEDLPSPSPVEAHALAGIEAPPDVRLACQLRPVGDLAILPLLPADATAAAGKLRGGLEGRERAVAVMFVDLRGSTALSETKLPYDVLFILNRFFLQMTRALTATGGHYSNFTGDGLMALYGLDAGDAADAVTQALAGARTMLDEMARLNRDLAPDLAAPLRMGIGIHFGEAIVGAMGPPGAQITSAIGDTVNTAARLEGLTKEFDCPLVLSRRAAEAAGLTLPDAALSRIAVKGRVEPVEFYALDAVP